MFLLNLLYFYEVLFRQKGLDALFFFLNSQIAIFFIDFAKDSPLIILTSLFQSPKLDLPRSLLKRNSMCVLVYYFYNTRRFSRK